MYHERLATLPLILNPHVDDIRVEWSDTDEDSEHAEHEFYESLVRHLTQKIVTRGASL